MKYNTVSIAGLLIILAGVAASIVLYMQSSRVWLDETFTVPPGQASAYCRSFSDETALTIYINVTSDGDGDINFWVMDETDWEHFKQGESFYYYIVPSEERITATTTPITWKPPANQEICFVYDNTFSLTTKTVYTKIIEEWDILRSLAFLIAILTVSIGIRLYRHGSNYNEKCEKPKNQNTN